MEGSLYDYIEAQGKTLDIDWESLTTKPAFKEAVLFAMVEIARAYHKKFDRKVSKERFIKTYWQVSGASKTDAEAYGKNIAEMLGLTFTEEQSLRVNLTYFLHDYPSKNAAPGVPMEDLLSFMVKENITNNRELISKSTKFEFFSRDEKVVSRLRSTAESLIFNTPEKTKSPKPEGHMTRKQLVTALNKCLASKS